MKAFVQPLGFSVLVGLLAIPAATEAGLPPVPLPPPLLLPAPPPVVILPDTDVYVAPDVEDDLFFSAGWWWRPWNGRWYRSRYCDRGWDYYPDTPRFYRDVPSGWRHDYRARRWGGGPWDYRPIPHAHLQQNWGHWESTGHWRRPENRQHHFHHDGRPIEEKLRIEKRRVERHERQVERREKRREDRAENREKRKRAAEREKRRETHRRHH